jgi:RNA polymerase sigma-70 factor, ECF subfamily
VSLPVSDQIIINNVLGGNSAQYNELILRHKDYAYSLALKIVHNAMDAEEIAHDAFVKAYTSLNKFNQQAKFSTWLYRIVFNTAISHMRKNRLQIDDISELTTQPDSGYDSSDPLFSQDREKFIGAAMRYLKPLDATLITLFYMQQLTLEEIGDIVGLQGTAVKVKLFRARKKLASALENILQEEVKEIL